MGLVSIGNVVAQRGETKWGYATQVELRDGTSVGLPVFVVNGKEPGPKLVVTAATHPTEQVGPAAVKYLLRSKIDPAKLRGTIICFTQSNPFGMQFGEYVSPHDLVNMSVAYPGSSNGSVTSRFANFIWENAAKNADVVMDFHENVKPCLHFSMVGVSSNPETEKKAVELARAFGITLIRSIAYLPLPGRKEGDMSFSSYCMANGVPALTPEFEGSTEMSFSEDEPSVQAAMTGFMNVLVKLNMVDGKIEPQRGVEVMNGKFESKGMLFANRGGVVYRKAEIGKKLEAGTTVATITNPFGDLVEEIKMPTTGYIWGWTVGNPAVNRNWAVQSGSTIAFIFVDSDREF